MPPCASATPTIPGCASRCGSSPRLTRASPVNSNALRPQVAPRALIVLGDISSSGEVYIVSDPVLDVLVPEVVLQRPRVMRESPAAYLKVCALLVVKCDL